MTVTLKPIGRGRWAPMTIRYDGPQTKPILVRIGQVIELGGVRWRVCGVMA